MSDNPYKHPPIIEAVVEFLAAAKPDDKKSAKAIAALKKVYDEYRSQTQRDLTLDVRQPRNPVHSEREVPVHSFFGANMSQRAVIRDASFLVLKTAPYKSWPDFRERIVRDRGIWHKYIGNQKIHRLGMRYINRIDLPLEEGRVGLQDYLSVYPQVPENLELSGKYTMNIQSRLSDLGATLTITSSTLESPLPNHAAVILDFDILKVFDRIVTDEEAMEFFDQARLKKNEVFESAITDKTRARLNGEF